MTRWTDRQRFDEGINQPEASEHDVRRGISLTASQPGLPLGSEVDDHGRQTWVLVEIPEVRNCFLLFLLQLCGLYFGLRGGGGGVKIVSTCHCVLPTWVNNVNILLFSSTAKFITIALA